MQLKITFAENTRLLRKEIPSTLAQIHLFEEMKVVNLDKKYQLTSLNHE